MKNITDQPVTLEVGERIVQGVFMPFLIVDGDEADGVQLVVRVNWKIEEICGRIAGYIFSYL